MWPQKLANYIYFPFHHGIYSPINLLSTGNVRRAEMAVSGLVMTAMTKTLDAYTRSPCACSMLSIISHPQCLAQPRGNGSDGTVGPDANYTLHALPDLLCMPHRTYFQSLPSLTQLISSESLSGTVQKRRAAAAEPSPETLSWL